MNARSSSSPRRQVAIAGVGAILVAAGAAALALAPAASAKNGPRGAVHSSGSMTSAMPTNDDFRFHPVNTPKNSGANPCPADVTTQGAGAGDPGYGVPDGLVTAADINYFVNAWVAQDLALADVTTQGAGVGDPGYGVPDGLVTAADLQYYVNLWVAGCP